MINTITPTLSPVIGWTAVHPAGGVTDSVLTTERDAELCAFNGKIYLTWAGRNATLTLGRSYVIEYNPSNSTWTRIDPGTATGNNFNTSSTSVRCGNLAVFNSKLYSTWEEENTGEKKIRVKVWSGSGTSWTFVDGNGADGLNKATTRDGFQPKLIVFNSKLYVVWTENASSGGNSDPQVRVKVYNGNDASPSWSFVDGGGALGLNKSTTEPAYSAVPVVFSGKLYLAWRENNASAVPQLRCKVYNGNDASPSWSFVDGNGANGLNCDVTLPVGGLGQLNFIAPYVFNSKLYMLWREGNNGSMKPVMKVYNGNDASPSWSRCDGGTANGLIFDTSQIVYTVSALVPDGWNPHLSWEEGPSSVSLSPSVYNGIDSNPRVKGVDTSDQTTVGGDVGYLSMAFLGSIYMAYISNVSGTEAIWVYKANV